jgi:hypothetical protein
VEETPFLDQLQLLVVVPEVIVNYQMRASRTAASVSLAVPLEETRTTETVKLAQAQRHHQ